MTNEEINRLVSERIMSTPVAMAPYAWTADDWLSGDTPTQTNVFAIINPSFKPGNVSPPAYCIPEYATDPEEASILESKILKDGKVEAYQNRLIQVLGLDMIVFNSAIELGYSFVQPPEVPLNTFKWAGHATLWLFSHALPRQKCLAALLAYGMTQEELS